MNGIGKCAVCEGDFFIAKMKDGKCDRCVAQFPNIKDKAELIKKRKETEEEKFNRGNFENRVKDLIQEALKEYGILAECECGNYFFKKSGAQKRCDSCKESN